MPFYEIKKDNADEPTVLSKYEFTGECPYSGSKILIKFGSSGVALWNILIFRNTLERIGSLRIAKKIFN